MSNLPPLDIRDGVSFLMALVALHNALTELSSKNPELTSPEVAKSLERASEGIARLLDSIDKKSR